MEHVRSLKGKVHSNEGLCFLILQLSKVSIEKRIRVGFSKSLKHPRGEEAMKKR